MAENQTTVRNIWKEGGTTFCISIPMYIVKKLDLNENNTLLVELVDELIVLKKHEVHITKAEMLKAKTVEETSEKSKFTPSQQTNNNNSNPLDGIDF